jgi:hypothetical protein
MKETEKASKLKFLDVPAQIPDGPKNSMGDAISNNPVCLDSGDSGAEGVAQPASERDTSRSDGSLFERPEGRR